MKNDESYKELHTEHRARYEKFVYFLMAAAGTCIGFTMTQHKEPSGLDGRLLLCALSCWGGSFYFGLRSIDQILHGLRSNLDYLSTRGRSSESLSRVNGIFRRADRAHRMQILFLLLGVVIYIYMRFQEIIQQLF